MSGADDAVVSDAVMEFSERNLRGARFISSDLSGAVMRGVDIAGAEIDSAVEMSVAGEWSFSQTLRHLVMATDVWLGKAELRIEQPYHPVGQANPFFDAEGNDASAFTNPDPTFAEVLEARADRQTMMRGFVTTVTADTLAETRTNPWALDRAETVLSCLHTILEEEWEHHRYAVRDLDAIRDGRSAR